MSSLVLQEVEGIRYQLKSIRPRTVPLSPSIVCSGRRLAERVAFPPDALIYGWSGEQSVRTEWSPQSRQSRSGPRPE